MSRGRKLTKAEKRERRGAARVPRVTSIGADSLAPVVADFSSAVLTADVALSICLSRCDDLVGDATLARVAREVWKDRPGLAAPLASSLTELVDELHRHRDRLRVLADQFTGMTDAEGLPVLSNAEFAAALARVASDHAPPADRPVAPEPGRR